jgi:fermentation-respiration switch protein FrsA (DUF1100 family)
MRTVKLMCIAWACILSLSVSGQEIAGDWHGILKIKNIRLRLVYHIQKEEQGYGATIDSPDQGAKGIPVTHVSYENAVLKMSAATIGATYEGVLSSDENITGTFKQAGQSFPLNLFRQTVEREKPARPQEPAKPYPYYEEEVSFENREDGVTLAGTLTLPQKGGNFPAVVLISGSGPQDRNEELMEHKPFLVIADYLTRNGIAVLRFDDRGTAASTGNFQTSTGYDFSKDAEAGVKYLQTRKEIDKKKIGLIGHSEGGSIAPMIAARNKNIAFIVLLAGTGIRGDQILLRQQYLIAEASGISGEDMKQARSINEGMFNIVLQSTDTEQLKIDLTGYLKQAVNDLPDAAKEIYSDHFIQTSVESLTGPWMQYFIKYDPTPALEKVTCPVLAVNGEKDMQVSAKDNPEAIRAALIKGGNKRVTTKVFPGLNHLFQECKTGLPTEYATIEQTFSPVVLEEIRAWLRSIKMITDANQGLNGERITRCR